MVIFATVIITVYLVGVIVTFYIINEGFKYITPRESKILTLIFCSLIWPYIWFRVLKKKES